MTKSFKSRPREYVEMKAGDILPHPMNPRTHSTDQRQALEASLEQFGDVRSLLCFKLPDGRVMNLDGHLRASIDPERSVKVELLTDITEDEAKGLLLTLDPLAAVGGYDQAKLNALRETAKADCDLLHNLWSALADQDAEVQAQVAKLRRQADRSTERRIEEQFYVLIQCDDEREQVALYRQLKKEGLNCQLKTC